MIGGGTQHFAKSHEGRGSPMKDSRHESRTGNVLDPRTGRALHRRFASTMLGFAKTLPAILLMVVAAVEPVSAAVFDVTAYGANGNDPLDADDQPGIQAAINAVPATGGVVYFPCGNYFLDSPLANGTGKNGLQLVGEGRCSKLISRVSTNSTVVHINNNSGGGTHHDHFVMRDLAVEGGDQESILVRCDFCRWGQIIRVWINASNGDGLWIGHGQDFTLSGSVVQANGGWGVR